jgi:hypothetical protein
MLILPLFGDQPENGANVVRLGAGHMVHLRSANAAEAAIVALRDVLRNGTTYRTAAQRVARVLQSEQGPKRAIDIMEQIYHAGADHLVPHYSQKSFITRHALDAMAVLLFTTLVLFYLIWRALRACIDRCRKEKSD